MSTTDEEDQGIPHIQWGQCIEPEDIVPFFALDYQKTFWSISDYILFWFPTVYYEARFQKRIVHKLESDREAECQFHHAESQSGSNSYRVYIRWSAGTEHAALALKPGDSVVLRFRQAKQMPDLIGFVARKTRASPQDFDTTLLVTEQPGCELPMLLQQRLNSMNSQRGAFRLPFLTFHDTELVAKRCVVALQNLRSYPVRRRLLLGWDVGVGERADPSQSGRFVDFFQNITQEAWDAIIGDEPESHAGAMKYLRNVANGFAVIYGPRGTGKTYLLSLIALALKKLGRKLAITAPNDVVADHATEVIIEQARKANISMTICRYTGSTNDVQAVTNNFVDYTLPQLMCRKAGFDLPADHPHQQPEFARLRHVTRALQMNIETEEARRAYIAEKDTLMDKLRDVTLAGCDVVIGTCGAFGDGNIHKSFKPAVVAVDEAGRATEPETLIPLTLWPENQTHVVLLGDGRQQMAPIPILSWLLRDRAAEIQSISESTIDMVGEGGQGVTSAQGNVQDLPKGNQRKPRVHRDDLPNHGTEQLKISLFARMLQVGVNAWYLTMQRRSVPGLFAVSNHVLYGERITDDIDFVDPRLPDRVCAREHMRFLSQQGIEGHQVVHWCDDAEAEKGEMSSSKYNVGFAGITLDHLRRLWDFNPTVFTPKNITVITMYNSQRLLYIDRIKELAEQGFDFAKACIAHNALTIRTADSARDSYARIVLVDLVATELVDRPYGNSFVLNHHRLDVAITRAQDGLMIVGDWRVSPSYKKKSEGRTDKTISSSVSNFYDAIFEFASRNNYLQRISSAKTAKYGTRGLVINDE